MDYSVLTFKDNNKEIKTFKLYNNKLLIIGENNSGKTKLLNKIYAGFLGKDSTFSFNDKIIGFGDYQVIYLKEKMDLLEEIKLTKTSNFRNKLIKAINEIILNNDKYNETVELLQKLNSLFDLILLETDLISNNTKIISSELVLKYNFSNLSVEGIVDKLLKFDLYDLENAIIDSAKYSSYQLRILLLNILIKYSDLQDKLRPLVFILDQPELFGTIKSLWNLINEVKNLLSEKSVIIMVSNCPVLFTFFFEKIEQVYFLKNNKIFSFENINSIIIKTIAIYTFSESDSIDYEIFVKDLSYVLTEEDVLYEKNNYIKNNILLILHIIYWDKILLKISDHNTFALEEPELCLEVTKANFIFVYLFLKNLDINIIVDNVAKTFFDKCNWLFN